MKIKVKYIIKIFISSFLLLNILILPVHSQNINFIKGKLEEIGIPKEYSKNIYEYIENLNINEGKIKKIISDSREIINDIKGGKSLKEFSLLQLSQIYSDALMLANELGIQVNIDYKDESDAIRKFNLANKMSPFMTAMFANSNIRGGVNTGYKTFRSLAWLNTDNERCGFATKFNKNMTFEDYLNTLLSVPMIFIKRDDEYINIDGKINFKTFMDKGYLDYTATLDDFLLHSNLFFPEVRLRKYIEIRNHDCCNEKYMYSLLAIYKGIFYNENAMFAVEDLLSELTINDISEFRYNIPRTALDTKVKGVKVNDITSKIIDIAHDSLKSTNDEDIRYLEPISILNKQGKTPCDVVEMPIV